MKSYHFKSAAFSLSVVVVSGIISVCFGFVYTLLHKNSEFQITTIPHIYYSVKTITAIDAQGNSFGNESVYRVDGMKGEPVKIADLPSGVSGAQWAPSTIQYDVLSLGTAQDKKFHVTLNNLGYEVWGSSENYKATTFGNRTGQILLHKQWVHPDGTYVVESEAYCTNSPTEGPCSKDFRLIVTDVKTSQQKVYTSTTFGDKEIAGYMSVLTDLTPTSGVIIISGLQDPGTSYIGVFDFLTGKVVRTLYLGTASSPTFLPYTFIRLSDDRQSLYFAKWFGGEETAKGIDAMDVVTGKITNIVSTKELTDYNWPRGSQDVYYKPNDSMLLKHNVVTEKETSIPWTKSVAEYLSPTSDRFTTSWVDSTSGVMDGKLIITDRMTGNQRVIFDQLHNENAYESNSGAWDTSRNAVIGDLVYHFLGIEQ